MSDASKTQFERPIKEIARNELAPLVTKIVARDGWHLLLLSESQELEGVCSSVRETLEAGGRELIVASAPGAPREALRQIAEAILGHYGEVLAVAASDDFLDVYYAFRRGLSRVSRGDRRKEALLLLSGLSPESARAIFARGRDEAWGWDIQTVVVAPGEDKDDYLLTYSDSFFLNQIYRLL